jgi:signal transduction histidine kinase/DNA-binding response OmpR family regulator
VVITIRSPWYRSVTAYIIYALLLLSLLFYIQRAYRRRAREQMDEEKMKFLINATHDIRSPLTLIMGPLHKMKQIVRTSDGNDAGGQIEGRRSNEMISSLETIEHNAQRILNLVNQILDVRKIDKQQMQLHCQPTSLAPFCQGICKMFEFNARERKIAFRFPVVGQDGDVSVWIDRRQMDKVVTNLLSNAFKYTEDGGSIELSISATDKDAVLQVIDSGSGLDGDSVKHIFDRFYQGRNSQRLHTEGTGIGLNLCKMIVDMHHGLISAQNRNDGRKGSVFTVQIPLGNAHLRPEEIDAPSTMSASVGETETATTQEAVPLAAATAAGTAAPLVSKGGRPHVLLVDDDTEITRYISSELSRHYKFDIAHNGKEGLHMVLTGDYDVVVSDVMMPEMDGFTMLRMIKTNANVAHVPVVMLTSMADVGNRLEGLERGADAFLAKPFDMDELHMSIDNQINAVRRLRGKFSGAQQQADKLEVPEVKGNDEELMERIMKVVNKHLGDSDFTVDMLTQEACISRTQLHRKMKEMTGLSTSEFIRNLRLEQAARLLKEQKINVTQVAYTVGFSNLAHFSTVFRKHFGVAPSEYIAKQS